MSANSDKDIGHDEVIQLIPWYVKGKLPEGEAEQVKRHLLDCAVCLTEVTNCQNIMSTMPMPSQTWKPTAAHFAGILAEVEKLEASAADRDAQTATHTQNLTTSRPKAKGLLQWIKGSIAATPSPVRWTLAFETLALAGLVAVAILPVLPTLERETSFETLSNEDKRAATQGRLIKLVFADDMTAKEMYELLSNNGLQLREGPSTVGVYVVEVPANSAEQALAALKAHPKLRLALLTAP